VFGHGLQMVLGEEPTEPHLFGCCHVSQQNTITGRLTPQMLEAVLRRADKAADLA
jgi:uracil-DNA glycosylase